MDPITALALSQPVKEVSNGVANLTKDIQATVGEGFESVMRAILPSNEANSVNEEELFSALIAERLEKHAGTEARAAYESLLSEKRSANTREDGYVNVEKAANEALDATVSSGAVSSEAASQVRSEAFEAAQLDENKSALYDDRGTGSDQTIAVMDMEAALIQAQQVIEKIENGELEIDEPETGADLDAGDADFADESEGSDAINPEGNAVDGSGGFLFKPESEHGNNLVVLLPSLLAGTVEEIVLKDDEGEVLERGTSTGYANPDSNGEREHFRFAKAGADYPPNITVEVKLTDGSTREYHIPDPSQRYD